MFWKRQSHKSYIKYFRTLKGVVGMLRDPEHTESVFDIEDGLRNIEATKLALRHVKQDPAAAAIIAERYLAPQADVDQLLRCPEESLGRAFAQHLTDHGFDPDYFRKIDVVDDVDYLLMRIRQTHDIWHIITGLGVDPIGELSLKAVELAQLRRPMAAVITSGGVLRYLIHDPDQLGEMLSGVAHGYRMGAAAKPLVAQKWELGWDRPLADWRAQVKVDVAIQDSPYLKEKGESAPG